MIYTSYFSNIKKLPKYLKPISISRFSPEWYEGDIDLSLAPSEELLLNYKKGLVTTEEYTSIYTKQLEKIDFSDFEKKYENRVLCCYEKSEDFCHRHILSDYLLKKGITISEKLTLNIAVIGSRTFNDYEYLKYRLNQLHIIYPNTQFKLISGAAKGADSLGEKWAKENNIETLIFPADWEKHGKSAGYIRNSDIINNSDIIISFWDGESKGTLHSMKMAKKQNKDLFIYQFSDIKHNITVEDFDLDNINQNKLYIFEDNMVHKGKTNSAIVRGLNNTFGIRLKHLGNSKKEAYFNDLDSEFIILDEDLEKLTTLSQKESIVLPISGFNSNSKIFTKSPLIYKKLDFFIDFLFNIKNISEDFNNNSDIIKNTKTTKLLVEDNLLEF